MARERSPAREEAKKLYLDSKGTMKLVDIADKLGLTDVKIRKWKNLDKWDEELKGNVPLKNKVERTIKSTVKKTKKDTDKEPIAEEIKEVLANTELNDKQRLFCVIYSRCLNATKAYQKAYKCTYESAMMNGSRLLRNDKVKEQIESLNATQFNKEFIKKSLIQKYLDIAFSDITDFMKFGKKDKIQYGPDGKPIANEAGEIQTYEESYVELRESDQIDGTLISEISEGNAGIKVKLADKMKAMDFLTKHYNLLNDEEKTKLDIEYKKLQNQKTQAEIDRMANGKGSLNDGEIKSMLEGIVNGL